MKKFSSYLKYIDAEFKNSLKLLENWVNINSGTENQAGLQHMAEALRGTFELLSTHAEAIPLSAWNKLDAHGVPIQIPLGKALSFTNFRPEAKHKVLFAGHMDTVFPEHSPFQKMHKIDAERFGGPGTADMKGGLVILYLGLKAFEESPYAPKISWEVFINPDEEIGSVGSKPLLVERAPKYDFGLLFEPAYADGALVGQRKGSANYTILAKGKAAHVGRDFHIGKSAISALARYIVKAETLQKMAAGITVNFGHIQGGGPVNIVPDLATCRLNVRFNTLDDQNMVHQKLFALAAEESAEEGINLEVHLEVERPPKPFDKKTEMIYQKLTTCASILDQPLFLRPSGGVSDGNILAKAGLPNLDTLGAIGGNIHTHDEYIQTESIKTRAKLLALFLMQEACR